MPVSVNKMTETNRYGKGRRKSKEWVAWTNKAILQFKLGIQPIEAHEYPVRILGIVEGDLNPRRDLSNMAKILEDALVKAGIITDDASGYVIGSGIEYDYESFPGKLPTIRIEIQSAKFIWRCGETPEYGSAEILPEGMCSFQPFGD